MKNTKYIIYQQAEKNLNLIASKLIKHKIALITPTDTVSGVISLNNELIYQIKQRDKNKHLILFISNLNQINIDNLIFKNLANKFWPGKLTLIYNKISYRMPNYNYLLKLIDLTGPIYSSSANISNQNPISSLSQAQKIFNKYRNQIIFLEGNYNHKYKPSTIYDIDTKKIIRQGDISYEQIKNSI